MKIIRSTTKRKIRIAALEQCWKAEKLLPVRVRNLGCHSIVCSPTMLSYTLFNYEHDPDYPLDGLVMYQWSVTYCHPMIHVA